MDKKGLKEKIKELPANLSITSFVLLLGLADRGLVALSEILEGPTREITKSYQRISKMKDFWDYYDEFKKIKENSARTILWRLQKKGLVKKKGAYYQLTLQGLNIIKVFQKKNKLESEEVWDGKWRMIMFDIPEKRRLDRNWLRSHLLFLDYKPLQKSVLIGQQPLEENFYEEIMERKIHQYIRLITVSEIDDEKIFRGFLENL